MGKIGAAIHEIHHVDTLAVRDLWVNRLHPLVKLTVTICYIAAVVSFPKYDVIGLAGMAVYPLAVFAAAELSLRDSLRRLRFVLPLVCFLGILNPFFDKNTVVIGGAQVSAGVLSMISLILKGTFGVLASYLLIATTPVEQLCCALRMVRVPKPIVTQLMLTYRYVTVLLEEAGRVTQAYALRAPRQKGVHFRVWGSLTGQLLLRSVDRAAGVYESMLLRGWNGDYLYLRKRIALRPHDAAYLLFWAGLIPLARAYPILVIVGNLTRGMFR